MSPKVAAADDLHRSLGWAGWVIEWADGVIVCLMPVGDPFGDISRHITRTIWTITCRGPAADCHGSASSASEAAGGLVIHHGIVARCFGAKPRVYPT
jgi:hypothetical protein